MDYGIIVVSLEVWLVLGCIVYALGIILLLAIIKKLFRGGERDLRTLPYGTIIKAGQDH